MKPNQLEDRLIQFAINIIASSKKIDNSFAAQHLIKQLIRSATSVALNYGEARSGESSKDFLHKMKICLKELRESTINIKIRKDAGLTKEILILENLISNQK